MIYGGYFDVSKKEEKIKELENETRKSSFWDDTEKAQKITLELNNLKEQISGFISLKQEILDNTKWNKDDWSKYTEAVKKAEVSFYSLRDIQEFGTECIAEYLSGNPRSVAKEVCEILLGKR